MNFGMLAAAGVALVTGTLALTGPREDRVAVAVFDPAITRESEQAADGRFDVPQSATWAQFFEAAGKGSGLSVVVHWDKLLEIGNDGAIEPAQRSAVTGSNLSLPEVLPLINETLAAGGNGLDYRAEGDKLIFSTIEHFDRREVVLATYDLSGIVEARLHDADPAARQVLTQQVTEEVTRLITSLVHPDQWVDNGGEIAKVAVFGSKLFVTAPKRFHPQIRWVLSELPTEIEGAGSAAAGRASARGGSSRAELASLERRAKAAQLKLEAIRTEFAQLEPLRSSGQMSSTEAARRQAELMEEEAEVLDQIAAIDNRRAELTGKPVVDGGVIREDGTVVDRDGRPAGGVELEFVPRMRVLPGRGADSRGGAVRSDTAVFRPKQLTPGAMRDVLGLALNLVPELKQAPMRIMEVDESEGVLKVTAPAEQLEGIGRIVKAMDLPGPEDRGDEVVTTRVALQSQSADTAKQLVELAYGWRPGLEKSFIGHGVTADVPSNTVLVTARRGQTEFIQRFIETLDGR